MVIRQTLQGGGLPMADEGVAAADVDGGEAQLVAAIRRRVEGQNPAVDDEETIGSNAASDASVREAGFAELRDSHDLPLAACQGE